jgi:predicted DsbA family dithiol-disulfide isomerase
VVRFAGKIGLDVSSFTKDPKGHRWSERVAAGIESAGLSGVAGTPSFFANGHRQILDRMTL